MLFFAIRSISFAPFLSKFELAGSQGKGGALLCCTFSHLARNVFVDKEKLILSWQRFRENSSIEKVGAWMLLHRYQ